MKFDDRTVFTEQTQELIGSMLFQKLEDIYSEENTLISPEEKERFRNGVLKAELIHGKYII